MILPTVDVSKLTQPLGVLIDQYTEQQRLAFQQHANEVQNQADIAGHSALEDIQNQGISDPQKAMEYLNGKVGSALSMMNQGNSQNPLYQGMYNSTQSGTIKSLQPQLYEAVNKARNLQFTSSTTTNATTVAKTTQALSNEDGSLAVDTVGLMKAISPMFSTQITDPAQMTEENISPLAVATYGSRAVALQKSKDLYKATIAENIKQIIAKYPSALDKTRALNSMLESMSNNELKQIGDALTGDQKYGDFISKNAGQFKGLVDVPATDGTSVITGAKSGGTEVDDYQNGKPSVVKTDPVTGQVINIPGTGSPQQTVEQAVTPDELNDKKSKTLITQYLATPEGQSFLEKNRTDSQREMSATVIGSILEQKASVAVEASQEEATTQLARIKDDATADYAERFLQQIKKDDHGAFNAQGNHPLLNNDANQLIIAAELMKRQSEKTPAEREGIAKLDANFAENRVIVRFNSEVHDIVEAGTWVQNHMEDPDVIKAMEYNPNFMTQMSDRAKNGGFMIAGILDTGSKIVEKTIMSSSVFDQMDASVASERKANALARVNEVFTGLMFDPDSKKIREGMTVEDISKMVSNILIDEVTKGTFKNGLVKDGNPVPVDNRITDVTDAEKLYNYTPLQRDIAMDITSGKEPTTAPLRLFQILTTNDPSKRNTWSLTKNADSLKMTEKAMSEIVGGISNELANAVRIFEKGVYTKVLPTIGMGKEANGAISTLNNFKAYIGDGNGNNSSVRLDPISGGGVVLITTPKGKQYNVEIGWDYKNKKWNRTIMPLAQNGQASGSRYNLEDMKEVK